MLELSPAARDRILTSLQRADPPRACLRVEARPGAGGFEYHLAAADVADAQHGDAVLDEGAFRILVDSESAGWLAGARLDYVETLLESGFRFDNPNLPPTPALPAGPRQDLTGSVADRVRLLLDSEINPALAAHGGRVELTAIEDRVVYLRFGGGCQGCGLVDVTLKQGVEARIRELVPGIERVVDTTDHATGQSPYFP